MEGTALDKEALKRGTSVYLADTVIPMLPKPLSNGICSLSEGEERLTLSCIMTIDERGKIQKSKIYESVIQSKHRMTYTDVNAIFDEDQTLAEKYQDILPDLLEMRALAELLRKRREEKGSIDFELEETAFTYDESGRVIGVGPRQRGEAERLIEEFMLAANKTVAEEYYWREIPFVYRVHEQPDDEKMKVFATFYANFGKIKGSIDNIHPKVLQKILQDIKGKPHENIVNQIMLRVVEKSGVFARMQRALWIKLSVLLPLYVSDPAVSRPGCTSYYQERSGRPADGSIFNDIGRKGRRNLEAVQHERAVRDGSGACRR